MPGPHKQNQYYLCDVIQKMALIDLLFEVLLYSST